MRSVLVIIGIILLVAFFTNPDHETHENILMDKLKPELLEYYLGERGLHEDVSVGEALGLMIGSAVAERFVKNLIIVDDYLLFSLSKITWEGQTRVIGIGAFGTVFLARDLEKYQIEL